MARAWLMRAGHKPARSPGQRTGHRPLSNPSLCPLEAHLPSSYPLTLKWVAPLIEIFFSVVQKKKGGLA
jgi:hypothetical protein